MNYSHKWINISSNYSKKIFRVLIPTFPQFRSLPKATTRTTTAPFTPFYKRLNLERTVILPTYTVVPYLPAQLPSTLPQSSFWPQQLRFGVEMSNNFHPNLFYGCHHTHQQTMLRCLGEEGRLLSGWIDHLMITLAYY